MTLWQFISSPEVAPFSAALGVLVSLFVLELVALIIGASIFGLGGDAPDIELGVDGPHPDQLQPETRAFRKAADSQLHPRQQPHHATSRHRLRGKRGHWLRSPAR